MRIPVYAFIPVLVLLLGACGQSDQTNNDPEQTHTSREEALKWMASAEVRCEVASDCPEGMAYLNYISDVEENSTSQCTGFLAGPDLLVTNSHCIPSHLRSVGAACSDYFAHFAAVPGVARETVRCKEILQFSNDGELGDPNVKPDYALMRLERPLSRKAFEVSTEGFPNDEESIFYSVNPIDPSEGNDYAGIVKRVCRNLPGTVILGSHTNPLSPIVALGDCPMIRGNSGSPLLGKDGRVRGVAHIRMFIKRVRDENLLPYIEVDPSPKSLIIASNFACHEIQGVSRPTQCQSTEGKWTYLNQGQIREQALPLCEKAAANVSWSHNAFDQASLALRWEKSTLLHQESSQKFVRTVFPLPKCINSGEAWRAHFASAAQGLLKGEGHVPTYLAQVRVNSWMQLQSAVVEDERKRMAITIDLGQLQRERKAKVKVESAYTYTWQTHTIFEGELPLCE